MNVGRSERIATTSDVTVHVRIDGPADAPAVVMLHGFMGSGRQWDAVIGPLVDAGFRTVRPDFRGHGASTQVHDESAYTFDRLRDDLVDVLDELELTSVHLVGHSMGGLVAQMVALEHQDRLRSLVLVDCSPFPGRPTRSVMRRLVRLVAYRVGAQRAVRFLAPVLSRLSTGQPPDRTRAERRADLDDLVDSLGDLDPAALVAFAERLQSHDDLRPFLSRITVPTTVVVGEYEVEALRIGCDTLAAGIPGSTLRWVDGAGHSPPMEQPGRFAAVLLAHLQAAPPEHPRT